MKKYIFIFLVSSIILCCQHEQDEQEQILEIVMPCICRELPWDYRVKNFTEEWQQLGTTGGVFENCQIPEDVLASLSTDDLAEICMRNPLLLAWCDSFYDFEHGPDELFEKFNGVRELFQREDAYKGLLKWYECALENLNFLYEEKFVGELEITQERAVLRLNINAATLLLSRYESQVDAKENYIEIVRQLVYGSEKMAGFPYPETESYCTMNFPNCFARAKMLIKIDEQNLNKIPMGDQNPIFGNFIPMYFAFVDGRDSCDNNEETIRIIDELSYQIIKENLY